jgi:hypothetical protein
MTVEALSISVARGNLYLSREVCETYLAGAGSVALLADEGDLLIAPLIQQSAGGALLKVKNLRGDRVIQAQEFFRLNKFRESFQEQTCPISWDSSRAALRVSDIARNM